MTTPSADNYSFGWFRTNVRKWRNISIQYSQGLGIFHFENSFCLPTLLLNMPLLSWIWLPDDTSGLLNAEAKFCACVHQRVAHSGNYEANLTLRRGRRWHGNSAASKVKAKLNLPVEQLQLDACFMNFSCLCIMYTCFWHVRKIRLIDLGLGYWLTTRIGAPTNRSAVSSVAASPVLKVHFLRPPEIKDSWARHISHPIQGFPFRHLSLFIFGPLNFQLHWNAKLLI